MFGHSNVHSVECRVPSGECLRGQRDDDGGQWQRIVSQKRPNKFVPTGQIRCRAEFIRPSSVEGFRCSGIRMCILSSAVCLRVNACEGSGMTGRGQWQRIVSQKRPNKFGPTGQVRCRAEFIRPSSVEGSGMFGHSNVHPVECSSRAGETGQVELAFRITGGFTPTLLRGQRDEGGGQRRRIAWQKRPNQFVPTGQARCRAEFIRPSEVAATSGFRTATWSPASARCPRRIQFCCRRCICRTACSSGCA